MNQLTSKNLNFIYVMLFMHKYKLKLNKQQVRIEEDDLLAKTTDTERKIILLELSKSKTTIRTLLSESHFEDITRMNKLFNQEYTDLKKEHEEEEKRKKEDKAKKGKGTRATSSTFVLKFTDDEGTEYRERVTLGQAGQLDKYCVDGKSLPDFIIGKLLKDENEGYYTNMNKSEIINATERQQ